VNGRIRFAFFVLCFSFAFANEEPRMKNVTGQRKTENEKRT
jgi:hypothetical protein